MDLSFFEIYRRKFGHLLFGAYKVNSVDPDEVAHNEPLYLDLHYLPS